MVYLYKKYRGNLLLESNKIGSFAFFLSKIDIKAIFAAIILTGCLFYFVVPESYLEMSVFFILSKSMIFAVNLWGDLLTLSLFFFVVFYFIKNGFFIRINWLVIFIAAYFIVSAISILINGGNYLPEGFSELEFKLKNFAVFCAMLYTLKHKDHSFIINCIVAVLCINCVLSYADIILDFGDRSGLFCDQNKYGKIVVIVNTLLLVSLFSDKNKTTAFAAFAAIAMLFINVILLESRGTYLLYFITTAIVIWQTKNKKIIFLGGILIIFVAMIFGYMAMQRIKNSKMNIRNNSDIGRISTIITGLRMWQKHPIIGIGSGTSRFRYKEFESKGVIAVEGMETIHNIYIAQLAETGIIGFLMFAFFNGFLIVKLLKKYKLNGGLYHDKYSLFYILAIFTYLIHGLVYHTFEGEGYYWFILAAAALYLKKDDSSLISK